MTVQGGEWRELIYVTGSLSKHGCRNHRLKFSVGRHRLVGGKA
jgi:hypothetical protein